MQWVQKISNIMTLLAGMAPRLPCWSKLKVMFDCTRASEDSVKYKLASLGDHHKVQWMGIEIFRSQRHHLINMGFCNMNNNGYSYVPTNCHFCLLSKSRHSYKTIYALHTHADYLDILLLVMTCVGDEICHFSLKTDRNSLFWAMHDGETLIDRITSYIFCTRIYKAFSAMFFLFRVYNALEDYEFYVIHLCEEYCIIEEFELVLVDEVRNIFCFFYYYFLLIAFDENFREIFQLHFMLLRAIRVNLFSDVF